MQHVGILNMDSLHLLGQFIFKYKSIPSKIVVKRLSVFHIHKAVFYNELCF